MIRIIAAAVAALFVLVVGGVVYRQVAVRHRAVIAAQTRWSTIDSAERKLTPIHAATAADWNKLNRWYQDASKASTERHHDYGSLSRKEIYDLAKRELNDVESMQVAITDIRSKDRSALQTFGAVYGDDEIAAFRSDVNARNEAFTTGIMMWRRLASRITYGAKAVVSGDHAPNAVDESARDYDEINKELAKGSSLQDTVAHEDALFSQRLVSDWASARSALFSTTGHV